MVFTDESKYVTQVVGQYWWSESFYRWRKYHQILKKSCDKYVLGLINETQYTQSVLQAILHNYNFCRKKDYIEGYDGLIVCIKFETRFVWKNIFILNEIPSWFQYISFLFWNRYLLILYFCRQLQDQLKKIFEQKIAKVNNIYPRIVEKSVDMIIYYSVLYKQKKTLIIHS